MAKLLSLGAGNLQFFAQSTTTSMNTGSGSVATKPQAYYDKLMLELLVQSDFHHSKLAQQRPMPKKYGDTVNFRKITKLTASTSPLTEGVTPSSLDGSVTAISATTEQHGDWMEFTDKINLEMVDPVIKEYTKELARAMREKLDNIVRDELAGGSQVMYANGKTGRTDGGTAGTGLADGDIPTINDFRRMVLEFKKNHVKPAQSGKFVSFITPEVAFDLMDDAKFEKAYEIGQNNTPFIKGEIADLYGIKFIEVVNGKTFDASAQDGSDIHASILLGRQAYGITKLKGEGVKTIVKPLGSAGSTDPLDQRQTVGVKINAFVAKRLEEQAIYRYESVPTNA